MFSWEDKKIVVFRKVAIFQEAQNLKLAHQSSRSLSLSHTHTHSHTFSHSLRKRETGPPNKFSQRLREQEKLELKLKVNPVFSLLLFFFRTRKQEPTFQQKQSCIRAGVGQPQKTDPFFLFIALISMFASQMALLRSSVIPLFQPLL